MTYDFYERLKNGESADDIAKAITADLNKAMKQVKEEKEKEDAEAERKAQMMADADEIADLMNTFVKTYYDFDAELTGKDMIDIYNCASKFSNTLTSLGDTLKGACEDTCKCKDKPKGKDKNLDKAIDEVIDNFFARMGW